MRKDLIALPDNSKVWIYQTDRKISSEELPLIQSDVIEFTHNWKSHGIELDCYGHIFHSYFLVLVADDSKHVSGCSIDSSVHFIQNLESKYGIGFFDRLKFLYFKNGNIKSVQSSDFKKAINEGELDAESLIFNNLVSDKKQFLDSWVSKVEDSWHSRYL